MDLQEAKEMAEQLISEHCPEYKFKYGRMKTQLGNCNSGKKVIKLSKYFTQEHDKELVKNTILHEIAHALTKGHGHNHVWKAKARAIGCNAERITSANIPENIKSQARYVYVCPNCDIKSYSFRTLKRKRACKQCCDKYNDGRYSSEFEIKFLKREY